ncbi:MAG: hypothetical protein IPP90_11905 [Gemmatimonadaceae bacterium]|nr:hypothetical protein [Gemmatimonadaceae bacterium]
MTLFTRIAMAATALSVAALSPVTSRAQALPSASDIVAKYVAAIGGKDEIMKVTSIKQTAVMDVPAIGLSAKMEVYAAAPNKMASKTNIPGMGEMLNGYNGTVGWDMNPMQGPRLLADKELTNMAENADFYANMLYSADKYASMETVGDTTIGGEKAYKVKMVRKSSKNESISYFAATSGLLLGGSSTQESQMGTMQVSQSVSEYRKFGALMLPTKVEQSMGPQKMIMTIQDVTINGAPESAFAIPEQVKPLIKP